MNATELTIGDWVYFGSDEYSPSKIEGILPYDEGIVLDFDNEPVANDNIRPIPLTEEIIKANGLIKVQHLYALNKHLYICAVKGEYYITNVFNNIFAQIYYVHELQHALRLCGLQELADNFKV